MERMLQIEMNTGMERKESGPSGAGLLLCLQRLCVHWH